jgi:glycosyltransferase involved in cell wall biosynthesis
MIHLKNIFNRREPFRVVAITIARNEELYMADHIKHLAGQGIELILIDNDSTDKTKSIAQSFIGLGVQRIINLPYTGSFNLKYLLNKVIEVAHETVADWIIFLNPDEFPLPLKQYKSLKEAFIAVEKKGYNSVNFDEFVFLPESESACYEGRDFFNEMSYYYYFDPSPLHRVIAWKANPAAEFKHSGGHRIQFPGQKIYPESFPFKHFIFLSLKHAISKYGNRLFSKEGINRGWHKNRVSFKVNEIILPPVHIQKKLTGTNDFDRSDPKKDHLFMDMESSFSRYKQKYLYKLKDPEDVSGTPQETNSAMPVPFIVGFPGSGIHIIQSILDPYFAFINLSPDPFFFRFFDNEDTESFESFLKVLDESKLLNDLGLSREVYLKSASQLGTINATEGIRLIFQSYARLKNKKVAGNSSPDNYNWIAGIQRHLPEAYFIHVIEDIRSILARKKASGSLSGPVIENITSDWVMSVIETKQQAQFCSHYLEVKIEDFLFDPSGQGQKILEFLDINASLDDLNGLLKNAKYNDEASLNLSSDEAALSAEEILIVESIAGMTLSDSGYK